MLDSFTAAAQRAVDRARARAARRGSKAAEPGDLLAALADEPESRASEVLIASGFDPGKVWDLLGTTPLPDDWPDDPARETLPQSAEFRAALADASVRARAYDRGRGVGTEHLLYGLLSNTNDAADRLAHAGADLDLLLKRLSPDDQDETGPIPLANDIAPLELGEPVEAADLGRILDASANRAREGLRVVEDYVRFALDDPGLTRRLKDVRHRLAAALQGFDRTS